MLFDARLVSEHGERGVEGAIGEVVALGPALPGGESLDVEPVFADGGQPSCRGGRWCRSCGAGRARRAGWRLPGRGVRRRGRFVDGCARGSPRRVRAAARRCGRRGAGCGVAGEGRCRVDVVRRRDAGVLRPLGSRRGAGRLDRRRLLRPLRQERESALAAAAVACARRADCCASRVSASRRARWASARTPGNQSGISQRGVGVGASGAACRGADWARARRWVVAGMSARSTARMASRTSRASAMSSLSVTTHRMLSLRPRVAATYRPRRVVTGEVRAIAVSTVSDCQPCSVAA